MNILMGFGIIFGVMVILCIAAVIVYSIVNTKNKNIASNSLPDGTDQSDFAKVLQDKYKAERDSGEFRRNI